MAKALFALCQAKSLLQAKLKLKNLKFLNKLKFKNPKISTPKKNQKIPNSEKFTAFKAQNPSKKFKPQIQVAYTKGKISLSSLSGLTLAPTMSPFKS